MTRPECPDCGGTGVVPAGGWESWADAVDGYVPCETCREVARGQWLFEVRNRVFSESETAALEQFDAGTPVLIREPNLRLELQLHRWGRHEDDRQKLNDPCPACRREALARWRGKTVNS